MKVMMMISHFIKIFSFVHCTATTTFLVRDNQYVIILSLREITSVKKPHDVMMTWILFESANWIYKKIIMHMKTAYVLKLRQNYCTYVCIG